MPLPKGFPVMALMPLRFANAHRFLAASESFFLPAAVSCPLLGASTFAGGAFAAFGDAFRFVELLRCRVRVAARADTDPLVRLGPSISRSAVMAIKAAEKWIESGADSKGARIRTST